MTGPTGPADDRPTPIRRAGRLLDPDGGTRLWTVAEGTRGRRWRERWSGPGGDVALLLETDPGGRWRKLELAGPAGLLTLHPEDDDSAVHGNIATKEGVRHLAFPWSSEHRLHVTGSMATLVVVAQGLADDIAVGEGTRRSGLVVTDDGDVAAATLGIWHLDPDGWAIQVGDRSDRIRLDGAGLPTGETGTSWPLELEPG
jgi:hypothetical protein